MVLLQPANVQGIAIGDLVPLHETHHVRIVDADSSQDEFGPGAHGVLAAEPQPAPRVR